MHYRAPGSSLPTFSPFKFVCFALCLAIALVPYGASAGASGPQSRGDLRFELPANGNLRIENLRGAVIAEVWNENYVSVSAIGDTGQKSSLPAIVDPGKSLLSIRLGRGVQASARINLELRIPARTHLAVSTSDGSIELRGLPAALLAQSVSGEIHVELPSEAKAAVVADSKTGTVSSSISGLVVNRAASPQLQGRIGDGGSNVRLYSQAGNI